MIRDRKDALNAAIVGAHNLAIGILGAVLAPIGRYFLRRRI